MGFQTTHCPGPHTKIVLLCFEKQPGKKCLPKIVSVPAGTVLTVEGDSLPSHRLSLPGSGRAFYKDTGNHSHLLWEPEGSIFLVIKGINTTQAKGKSQITYTDYPPLLREPDKNYGLLSGCLHSECHSNTHVYTQFAALPVSCRYSQRTVCNVPASTHKPVFSDTSDSDP